jgi:hypothetical protein
MSGGSGPGAAGVAYGIFFLFMVVVLAVIYFTPLIVAIKRKNQVAAVAVLNVFLGWTLVGWVVAMVMAVSSSRATMVVVQNYGAPPAPTGLISADGNWRWDGQAWRPTK